MLGKLDISMQKMETRSMFFILYKYNSKWINHLNIRPEILKLMGNRAGNTLVLVGIGKDFLNRTQMAQQLRERIDKWDYMKLKTFFTAREMVTKLKGLPTEWEYAFANYTSDSRLMTITYRELKKLNSSN
jgi:hypothetical protein